jgi:hypothetical protein
MRPLSFLIVGALLLGCVPVLAQSGRGTISGTVIDSAGAVVPGANIIVTNPATGVSSTTRSNETGTYTVPDLPVGEYSVQAEKEGFKALIRSGITLNAASSVRIDFSLEIGETRQVIEVKGDAPQLKTEDVKISSTVNNRMVEALPLVVGGALRSPLDLASLTPEAKNFGTSVALGPASDSFSIGGGQPRAYGITLDGVSMGTGNPLPNSWVTYNTPPLDAITEFTVDTNGFKAEYGHAMGGIMSFSSKSGTNTLHGSVFEFLRNNALDANRFFSNRAGLPRAIYKQSDFGVSAGGPVYIPKLYDGRNKTFFFAAYEGFRNRIGATGVAATVPTPEMLEGDFSNWVNSSGQLIPIYDPATLTTDPSGRLVRTPFPGNRIPRDRFDPLAAKLLQVYQSGPAKLPAPNNGAAPGTVGYVQNNYLITKGSTSTPWDKFSLKVDHVISDKSRVSGYYGRNRETNGAGPAGPAALPGYYSNFQYQANRSDIYRGSWTYTLTPTLLNYVYGGVNHWKQKAGNANQDLGNWKEKFCLPNVPDCNKNLTTALFTGDGLSQWGSYSSSGSNNPLFKFGDDLTWVRGRHTLKFGGMHQKNYYSGFGEQGISGGVTFSPIETGAPGVTNFAAGGGSSFASLLLGLVDNGRTETFRFIAQQFRYYAAYAQDDFRVSNRLTLNLGLRWETTLPPIETEDRYSDFSPTTPNPAAGNIPGALVFAGTGPGRVGRRAIAPSNFKSFGPRLGLAYSLDDKTVLRTGFSRSFGFVTAAAGSSHFLGFVTIFTPTNTTLGVQPTFRLQDGFPPYPLPPQIDPSFGNGNSVSWWQDQDATLLPTSDSWTLSIQRQLSGTLIVEGAYSGMKGTHLQSGLNNYNQVPYSYLQQYGATLLNSNISSPAAVAAGIRVPYPGFTGSVAQALRPFPQVLEVDTRFGGGDHSGNSTYHAAIMRVEKRFGDGLTFQSSYVFSKTLSDSDSAAGYMLAMDQANHRLDKSISGFDITHNFKLAWIYELPFGKSKKFLTKGVGSALLGGWRLSGVHYYSSGLPVGLATSVSLPLFAGTNRPTVNTYDGWGCSNVENFDPTTNNFFQPASFFGAQPSTVFGNATRYNPKCREFPNYTENASVSRTFKLRERLNLEFRCEAFNLLNRVRFGTGSTTLQSQTFGRLTSNSDILNTPRQVQFALKLNW